MNRENSSVEELDQVRMRAEGEPQADAGAPEDAADAALQKAQEETAELTNQLLRMRAEFDNFRRRVAKEKEDLRDHATMESLRGFLAVADDFERALAVECADTGYAQGMRMIYSRLLEALKKQGVETIDAHGKPFDPNLHHAIEMVNTSDAPDHTILQVYQPGYLFKGQLLRPAIVKVAVAPQGHADANGQGGEPDIN